MFGWFSGKKEVSRVREEIKGSFDLVKKDINDVGEWIKHLDSEKKGHKSDIEELKNILSTVQTDLEELREVVSIMGDLKPKRLFTTTKHQTDKQTAVYAVQTDVQTDVQTSNLDRFSITERAIIWVLLNTDLKLSYEDVAAMLGKEKATIRGQINGIRQKSRGLIEEIIEKNNKKRVYITEEMKKKLLKRAKVRVKIEGKKKKKGED